MLSAIRIIAFLLLSAAFVQAQPQRRMHKLSTDQQAVEHIRFEEYNEAIPKLRQLVGSDPTNPEFNYMLGKSLFLSYRKNEALKYFDVVNRVNPEVDPEFHSYYAQALHSANQFDKAILEYGKELERFTPESNDFKWVNNRIAQCQMALSLAQDKEGELVKVENLGETINTRYAEHSPVISEDGKMLLYTARRPESTGARPELDYLDEDIYVAYKQDGSWSLSENLGKPINTKGHDATIALTPDGNQLYIYRHKRRGGLYVVDRDSGSRSWSAPKALDKPLNSRHYEASVSVGPGDSLFFFSSDRPGGFGGTDLYVAIKQADGEWGEARNLGAGINTPFDEDAPFIHPDGKTLYFASNGPASMGGYDIFVSEMTGDNAWSAPINLGSPVNSTDDEIYFVLSKDGRNGFYTSGRAGGFGEKDIYSVELPYFPFPGELPVFQLAGSIQDANSLDTLENAFVKLVDQETDQVVDSMPVENGAMAYEFEVEPERAYSLVVEADGYETTTEDVLTPSEADNNRIERNVFVSAAVPSRPETTTNEVPIRNLYFDFNKSRLRSSAKEELDRVAIMMNQDPQVKLELIGHSDWYGTYEYNIGLSKKRVEAAYKYLVKRLGIDSDRISKDFFSENRPIDDNGNDVGRQYNRRVEFRFVDNDGKELISKRERDGADPVFVDNTPPATSPGFDNPDGVILPSNIGAGVETSPGGFADNRDLSGQVSEETDNDAGSLEDFRNLTDGGDAGEELTRSNDDNVTALINDLSIRNIYFGFDKSGLEAASVNELDKIIQLLKGQAGLKVEIYGHTDSQGSVTYNQRLSEKRCNKAFAYLTQNGVSEDQLFMTGFSELKPVASNSNSSGRQSNRRVEFRIIENGQVIYSSIP